MENQINPEQNPISQQTQIPEKPKINYWLFSTILLLIILLVSGVWFILSSKNRIYPDLQPVTSNQANQIVVTGVIRTSGLSEEEKQKLNLSSADFQITDFNKGQSGLGGYYLVTGDEGLPYKKDDFEKLLGKCLKIEGTIPPDWENNSYDRAVLVPSKIEKLDYSNCSPYLQTPPVVDNTQEKLILRGTVVRVKRPAPDIGYDYQLTLTEPFTDKLNATGQRTQPQNIIDIVPPDNATWIKLEENINKEISVEGYMVWGYAESREFEIISVKW